ncbi:DNA topoisomerase (ATP-hydrolyzing) subunit B [Thermosulfuriphilus ammonigenes]|uniref:DNA gyrase subunit B n=1 Tax=Thermosulfuriphilus ammonigenes TaxID=1936021 RepID=A0A6G7PW32_9BACT|nr:DNA topoisomerase (ATP-hydrolyzing) subunit B [Thermosulfuriphilus ammonigenes]MBA2847911.1 DNA gyrase subunit B [Thermosulfuriphilus ammonigenes]QIJ71894.1 DNA topoisomerase (ATP-hydrolyzing) subunit B [Thermosulfuriphilus ammonigenes]
MIKKYDATHIKVLAGLEAVRKRPAMYIGSTGEDGLHHLVYEVLDNSIDEALAGYCSFIKVTIHKNNSVTVEDNGRGIPVDIHPTEGISALEVVMTKLHAGGKFDNQIYKVSGGLHGVGVSVVNALSEWLIVEVKRDGCIWKQEYKRGKPVTPLLKVGKTKKTGTSITFKPDPQIFKETTEFKYEILQSRLRELAFLNKNIKIVLKDERTGAEDVFHYKGGIVEFVQYLNRKKDVIHPKPIYISGNRDFIQVEVAFQYNDSFSEKLYSYVNNIHTKEGGTHVSGFRAALTKCINKYINNDKNLPKSMKIRLEGDDLREGLSAVVSVRMPNPQFEGQTKTKLGNSEIKSVVESIVAEGLSIYLEENPSVARKIIAKVVESARAREAAKRARELVRKKSETFDVLVAGKLAECQAKDPEIRELFIVEGDSAGGSAKQGRDRRFQAILPLRGKILNVEKARFDKMISSEEIRQLVASLGTGIGPKDFNPDKCRYHKIIIMTDADVDGAHIRTLLLTFFYRQMPELIERGYLFIAQPPLYRILENKKEFYLKDDQALDEFLFKRSLKNMSVSFLPEDKEVSPKMLNDLFKNLSLFIKTINDVSKKGLWIDLIISLLEMDVSSADQFNQIEFVESLSNYLRNKNYKVSQIKPSKTHPSGYEFNVISKDLSYLTANISADIPLIPEYHKAYKLFQKIKPFYGKKLKVKIRDNEFILDNLQNFLSLIRTEGIKNLTIQRYKGLGEMNPDQLWQTTMNPETRTLLRINISDAEKAEELFTTLMGDKVEPRREFIQTHALEVRELDI